MNTTELTGLLNEDASLLMGVLLVTGMQLVLKLHKRYTNSGCKCRYHGKHLDMEGKMKTPGASPQSLGRLPFSEESTNQE